MAVSLTSPNLFRELMWNIETIHEKYLREDKSSLKIKHRNILQEYIKEYLSLEHHQRKFAFSITTEILRRSVQLDEFSAEKAAEAWLALSTYANNLFSQPWRKEYREIKLYSGFYKYQIESSLIGAESMLELMGYKRAGDRMVLVEPLSADCLIKTSLDALRAVCECEILFSVHAEVSKCIPNCSWANILRIREQYPGTANQTIHAIMSIFRHPSDCCTDCLYSYSTSYQPSCRRCQENMLKMQAYMSVSGYSINGYYPPPMAYIPTDNRMLLTNGHYTPVPTGKLIDLDDSYEVDRTLHRKVITDRWQSNERRSKYDEQFTTSDSNNSFDDESTRKRDRIKDVRRSGDRANSIEDWEYVYRRLGKKDHSAADKSESNYRMAAGHVNSGSRTNGVSEAFTNLKLSPDVDPNISHCADEPDSRKRANAAKTSSSSTRLDLPERRSHSNTKRLTDDKRDGGVRSYGEQSPTWVCSKCTYQNSVQKDVCEMCSKSRHVASEALLTSGGKHCIRCTLVNEREAVKCEACDADLENSPTYV